MGHQPARGAVGWRWGRGSAVSENDIRQRVFGNLEQGAMEDDVRASLDPRPPMES